MQLYHTITLKSTVLFVFYYKEKNTKFDEYEEIIYAYAIEIGCENKVAKHLTKYTKFIGDGLAFSFKKIYLTLTPYKNQHNIFMVNGKISLILLKEYKIPKHEDFVVFVCTEDRDFNAPLTRLFKKNLI